jgi:hypothetical protein
MLTRVAGGAVELRLALTGTLFRHGSQSVPRCLRSGEEVHNPPKNASARLTCTFRESSALRGVDT